MNPEEYSEILKALADRTRQRLVKTLISGEFSVNELAERLDISQFNASKHLRVLRQAGIVGVRAKGQRREYFIAEAFRDRLNREGMTLDFGCCTFRMDRLPS